MEIISIVFVILTILAFLILYLFHYIDENPFSNNNQHTYDTPPKQDTFHTSSNHYVHTNTAPPPQRDPYEDEFPYMPYQRKKLLTYTEYQFYKIMKQACDEKNLLICPKVRLEDFINVTERKYKMKYRGYIKARHVDFIVTDSQLNVLCGIELDDPSHNTQEAAKTDAFKNKLFRTIGIPLFRIDTSTKYEIRMNYIFRQLGIIPPTQTYQAEQAAKQNTP